MINLIKKMAPLAFAAIILTSSCTNSEVNTTEQTEINKMDSSANALKQTTDSLEDQTKKVEASLEKLDSEFKPTN
jgi:septal ring factor EnvC (AmiA/AmiB activator)